MKPGGILYLFSDEYHVPLLPPEAAAFLATGAELGLPVLLIVSRGRWAVDAWLEKKS